MDLGWVLACSSYFVRQHEDDDAADDGTENVSYQKSHQHRHAVSSI